MVTCKDCIHEKVCFVADDTEYKSEKAIKLDCPSFKNKADFVEVVRCKDCKHWSSIGFAENAGWCEKKDVAALYDGFCESGERK